MLQRSNGADRGRRGTGAQASGSGVGGAAQGTYGVMSFFRLLCFPNPRKRRSRSPPGRLRFSLRPVTHLPARWSLYCSSSQFVLLPSGVTIISLVIISLVTAAAGQAVEAGDHMHDTVFPKIIEWVRTLEATT